MSVRMHPLMSMGPRATPPDQSGHSNEPSMEDYLQYRLKQRASLGLSDGTSQIVWTDCKPSIQKQLPSPSSFQQPDVVWWKTPNATIHRLPSWDSTPLPSTPPPPVAAVNPNLNIIATTINSENINTRLNTQNITLNPNHPNTVPLTGHERLASIHKKIEHRKEQAKQKQQADAEKNRIDEADNLRTARNRAAYFNNKGHQVPRRIHPKPLPIPEGEEPKFYSCATDANYWEEYYCDRQQNRMDLAAMDPVYEHLVHNMEDPSKLAVNMVKSIMALPKSQRPALLVTKPNCNSPLSFINVRSHCKAIGFTTPFNPKISTLSEKGKSLPAAPSSERVSSSLIQPLCSFDIGKKLPLLPHKPEFVDKNTQTFLNSYILGLSHDKLQNIDKEDAFKPTPRTSTIVSRPTILDLLHPTTNQLSTPTTKFTESSTFSPDWNHSRTVSVSSSNPNSLPTSISFKDLDTGSVRILGQKRAPRPVIISPVFTNPEIQNSVLLKEISLDSMRNDNKEPFESALNNICISSMHRDRELAESLRASKHLCLPRFSTENLKKAEAFSLSISVNASNVQTLPEFLTPIDKVLKEAREVIMPDAPMSRCYTQHSAPGVVLGNCIKKLANQNSNESHTVSAAWSLASDKSKATVQSDWTPFITKRVDSQPYYAQFLHDKHMQTDEVFKNPITSSHISETRVASNASTQTVLVHRDFSSSSSSFFEPPTSPSPFTRVAAIRTCNVLRPSNGFEAIAASSAPLRTPKFAPVRAHNVLHLGNGFEAIDDAEIVPPPHQKSRAPSAVVISKKRRTPKTKINFTPHQPSSSPPPQQQQCCHGIYDTTAPSVSLQPSAQVPSSSLCQSTSDIETFFITQLRPTVRPISAENKHDSLQESPRRQFSPNWAVPSKSMSLTETSLLEPFDDLRVSVNVFKQTKRRGKKLSKFLHCIKAITCQSRPTVLE